MGIACPALPVHTLELLMRQVSKGGRRKSKMSGTEGVEHDKNGLGLLAVSILDVGQQRYVIPIHTEVF